MTAHEVLQRTEVPALPVPTVLHMLQSAIEKGISPDALEKLVSLHERVSREEARKEFFHAYNEFQRACPLIPKTSEATITSRTKGTSFPIKYADMAQITTICDPLLHSRGFSYSFDSEVEGKLLKTYCILSHVGGHEIRRCFICPAEFEGGIGSSAQSAGGVDSVANRRALCKALGITSADPDRCEDELDPTPITEAQADEIHRRLEETDASMFRFLKHMNAERVEEIPASKFKQAMVAIAAAEAEKKRQAAKGAKP